MSTSKSNSTEGESNSSEPQDSKKSLTKRTARGMGWMLGSSASQIFLRTFFFVALARLLSPEDYGVFGAALVIMGFANIFSQVGVGQSLIYLPEINNRQIASANLVSVLLGLFATALLWISAPLLAWFFEEPMVTGALRLMSFAFLFRGVSTVSEALLERDLQFQAIAIREVAINLLGQGLVGVPLAILGFDYWALCWAYLATEGLRAVILLVLKPTPILLRDGFDVQGLVRFGSGMSTTALVNRLAIQLDTIIVGRFLGIELLGHYSRAFQLAAMPSSIFGKVYSKVLFPAMNKVRDDRNKLRQVHSDVVAALALTVLPASVLIFFVAPHLIPILLGQKWNAMIEPFQILILAIYFRLGYKVSDVLMKSKGQVYRLALLHAIYAVYVFVFVLIGVQFGMRGVALGVLLSAFLQFCTNSVLGMRISGLPAKAFLSAHLAGICHAILVVVLGLATTVITDHYQLSAIWFLSIFATFMVICHLTGLIIWQLKWFGAAGRVLEGRLRLAIRG